MSKNRSALIASILLLIFCVGSIELITRHVDNIVDRDIRSWQDRLSVIAESRKRDIEAWLESQIDDLQELSGNPLVQIQLGLTASSGQTESVRGQLSHLRNLVSATAKRLDIDAAPQHINSERGPSTEGIALLDSSDALLMSTRGFPRDLIDDSSLIDRVKETGRLAVGEIVDTGRGAPAFVIVLPVSPVQSTSDRSVIGMVVAVIDPREVLYPLLAERWLTTQSDESNLVVGDVNRTLYVSPLQDKFSIFHNAAMSNEENAANFARSNPNNSGIRYNYAGTEVLVTSRPIRHTPWLLVQKVDSTEALRESKAHRDFIYTVFLLALFIITITFIAVWRHSTSMRLSHANDRLAARTDLLNAVTDSIRDNIFLLDADDKLVFINRALAKCADTVATDVRGRALNHIFGQETVAILTDVLDGDGKARVIEDVEIDGERYTYHVSVVTLNSGTYNTSRLCVMHDITDLQQAQEKHQELLQGIISTLVRVTDMHDPHCAHHSERTREVSLAIAEAMELGEVEVETLGLAAQLANIGKLNLPRTLLTKMEPLTTEEEQMMRGSVEETVKILGSLSFAGPVQQVIAQKNEHLDGGGYPEGLSGDAILLEARILSVANAFVAMLSSRAYRVGLPMREVMGNLLEDADSRYDRAVVAALFHISENRPDWSRWSQVED